jgi:TP901-1 family phage major tail protein
MAEADKTPKHGKNKILKMRLLKDATEKVAAKLALQTNHTWAKARSTNTTQTNDGAVNADGGLETTITFESLLTGDEASQILNAAIDDGEQLEIWEIDLATGVEQDDQSLECDAIYMQGIIESLDEDADVAGYQAVSGSIKVDGKPQKGKVKITKDEHEEVMYAFRDTNTVASV